MGGEVRIICVGQSNEFGWSILVRKLELRTASAAEDSSCASKICGGCEKRKA